MALIGWPLAFLPASPRAPASVALRERGRWYTQMLSCESTVRPPTSPMIQLFGRGFGHPGSGTKLGAVPPGAGFGRVRSTTRCSACDLDNTSIPDCRCQTPRPVAPAWNKQRPSAGACLPRRSPSICYSLACPSPSLRRDHSWNRCVEAETPVPVGHLRAIHASHPLHFKSTYTGMVRLSLLEGKKNGTARSGPVS